MTVRTIRGNALHLHGLSTEDKPINNIPDGSDFYETDTGVFWFFDVDTWVPKNSLETIRALLAGIINVKLTGSNVAYDNVNNVLRIVQKGVSVGINDAQSNTVGVPKDTEGNSILPLVLPFRFNGTNWDRDRNNIEKTLLASAARTTTTSSPVQTNYNGKTVVLTLNVTANPGGAETLELRLAYRVGVTSATIAKMAILAATNGVYHLIVGLGATATPENPGNHKLYSMPVPRNYVATVAPSASGSWTYDLTTTEIA